MEMKVSRTPPMSRPQVSVVIRTKDEGKDLGGVLDVLAAQSVRPPFAETIVMDSGSRDDTVAIARAHGVQVIEIPPETFTYGRGLNIGSAVATAPVIVALSGHAYPRDHEWLARLLRHFEDERVACASGAGRDPLGNQLTRPLLQDFELARRHPIFGYSNAAGGYRADLWRERPFREDMPYAEDKEWALHWMSRGRLAALDPALITDHDHTFDPPSACYRRAREAWRGNAMYIDVPPIGVRELVKDGLRGLSPKQRIHPSVWAALLGQYLERRRPGT